MTHSYRASGTPFVVSATNSALRTHVAGIEQSGSGECAGHCRLAGRTMTQPPDLDSRLGLRFKPTHWSPDRVARID